MEYLKLTEITKKKLDETYVVVYAIKNEINVKKSDIIEKNNIFVFKYILLKNVQRWKSYKDITKILNLYDALYYVEKENLLW